MQPPLTPAANEAIENLAQRYRVSSDAVRTLLLAVSAGGGSMAQFYHPELGGGGQWMRGGMTMVGDMFNHGLQATVSGLCSDLSGLLASQTVFLPTSEASAGGSTSGSGGSSWWPAGLGNPSSTGGQNDARYAYFPDSRRLAIDRGGRITLYDTLDHRIGGVQQQQGGASGSLSFSSQLGTFTVDSLPAVTAPGPSVQAREPPPVPFIASPDASKAEASHAPPGPASSPAPPSSSESPRTHADILATLERLGDLHRRGVLSDDEFRSKKAELLGRL